MIQNFLWEDFITFQLAYIRATCPNICNILYLQGNRVMTTEGQNKAEVRRRAAKPCWSSGWNPFLVSTGSPLRKAKMLATSTSLLILFYLKCVWYYCFGVNYFDIKVWNVRGWHCTVKVSQQWCTDMNQPVQNP